MLSIGPVVLGIAPMRARVFPRLAGVLLIVSGVASLVAMLPGILGTILEVISAITLAVAWAWCGSRLLTRQDETAEAVARPPPVAGVSRLKRYPSCAENRDHGSLIVLIMQAEWEAV